LKTEKFKIIFSKQTEETRDKGVPIVDSVKFSKDKFYIKGKNFRGVKSIKIQGQKLEKELIIDKIEQDEVVASPKGFLNLLTNGLTYIFLIENGYGSTPFLVSVEFPDNSISTEKIQDGAVTGSKIKDGTIPISKFSNMGAEDGDYLKWNKKKNIWEPTPLNTLQFKGVWNVEEKPNSPGEGNFVGSTGDYYIVSKSGASNIINEGEQWYEGDWIISNGDNWQRINNSGKVTSIFGREGAIEAQAGDYNWGQIDKKDSKISDLGDVDDLIPANGQVLQYNMDEEKWVPIDLKIEASHLQENSIDETKIENNAVTTEKIADFSIESEKISNNAITTEKIADHAVTSIKIEEETILNEDISQNAKIQRSKISKEKDRAGYILVNDDEGAMSSIPFLDISRGGTGATNKEKARSNLGLEIGRDIQGYSERLSDLAQLNFSKGILLGGNNSKLVLKDSNEIRVSLGLGKEKNLFVNDQGYVGIGTILPSEKLEINGNMNLRGTLNMNDFTITGLGKPEKDTDAVNRGWVTDHLVSLQNSFYYIHQKNSSSEVKKNGSLPMDGMDRFSLKNQEKFLERLENILKIKSIGLYKISFKATCANSPTGQMNQIEMAMKKGSQEEWTIMAMPKTFGSTMIMAEGIFTVESLDKPVSLTFFNKSDGTRSFELIQYTLVRIGDLN
jgi:hypothetical protein